MKEKRTGKKDRKLLWGTIIISMILSLMVFYVLYNANNKYMTREEKAIHGILYADGSYDSLPVYYLSREWEYYPDVLLTPGDDLEKYYFRYLSIGEYGGMELDDRNGNPYGSGTYRLRIMLPSEEHTYGLYLPEIFSAYNLYVDGKLIEQVGNPDPDHYEERIQHRMFTFKGQYRKGNPGISQVLCFYPGSPGADLLRMGVFQNQKPGKCTVCRSVRLCPWIHLLSPFAYLSGFAGTALVQSGNAVLLSHISGHAASGA